MIMTSITPQVYLGNYPERFTEEGAKQAIKMFQVSLENITSEVKKRNKDLHVPYKYLRPDRVPNSITIWSKLYNMIGPPFSDFQYERKVVKLNNYAYKLMVWLIVFTDSM